MSTYLARHLSYVAILAVAIASVSLSQPALAKHGRIAKPQVPAPMDMGSTPMDMGSPRASAPRNKGDRGGASADTIWIQDAWASALMDTSKPGAVYMKIVNVGTVADRLVSIETPVAMMAQPHKEKIKSDKMKMRQKRALFISAGGTINFLPGNLHIMLMGVDRPLHEGTTFPVTLNFEIGGAVTVNVMVKAISGMQSGGGHDQSAHRPAN